MEKRTHRKCDDKYFDALKKETTLANEEIEIQGDRLENDEGESFRRVLPSFYVKHHIKLAQQDLNNKKGFTIQEIYDKVKKWDKGKWKAWNETKASKGEFIGKDEVDRVFLKHFGAKLLSTDKERKA